MSFICVNCGLCCSRVVGNTIRENLGLPKDPKLEGLVSVCEFLKITGSETSCKIQEQKPQICRTYPVGEKCWLDIFTAKRRGKH